jgi:hypothetical protein
MQTRYQIRRQGERDLDVHHEGYQSRIHYVVLSIQDQPENSVVL